MTAWTVLFFAGLFAAWPAAAQYFGRNKVQYETFRYRTLKSDHYDIYYYPPQDEVAPLIARMAERWYARFAEVLDHRLSERQPIILYADVADFRQTNVISGLIDVGVRGVTEGLKNRVVLPLSGVLPEDDYVLGHELVHAFQFDILKSDSLELTTGLATLPLWFIEGMAEYLSQGDRNSVTEAWLRDAVLRDELPGIEPGVGDEDYSPYRHGHALWSYIAGRWGDRAVGNLFRSVATHGWVGAFRRELDTSPDSLAEAWQADVKARYGPVVANRQAFTQLGVPLLTHGGLNISPALSPDGRLLTFLSRRSLFSLDLFLADEQRGEILRKLVSSTADEHLDALRFSESAGSWSPDGRHVALVISERGDFILSIVDVRTGETEKIRIPDMPGLVHAGWSPGGDRLALFVNTGGIGDLHLYDLKTGETRQLTDDLYCEMQPAWSPSGDTLVFMTERGDDTDLESLSFGAIKIALMDVASGRMRLIALPGATRHISPQFSPDGRSLFFVANPDGGINDLFRYDLEDDRAYRLTRVATGLTGLTELAPVISVASEASRVIVTLYAKGGFRLHELSGADLVGTVWSAAAPLAAEDRVEARDGENGDNGDDSVASVDRLPDGLAASDEGIVSEYLSSSETGLPPAQVQFDVDRYRPKLQLLAVGQAYGGVAVDRFGTSLGGGIAFLLGDMLNNRQLIISVQANGGLRDIGGEVQYASLSQRLQWALIASHIPYRSLSLFEEFDSVDVGGEQELAFRSRLIRERIYVERGAVIAQYPLSQNRRIESGLAFSHFSYDREADEIIIADGEVISSRTRSLGAPSSIDLLQTEVAYVGDYSFFAFTGPVEGRRFRLEATPTFGTLRYLSLSGDYRHYMNLYPVIFAARLLHQGRYLEDAESDRLSFLYLGYPTLVRGYDIASDRAIEEGDRAEDLPGAVRRLIGSRIGVLNLEVRVPLFGNHRYGLINMPYLPLTAVGFLDGGVSWTDDDSPEWTFSRRGGRIPVWSAGAALRANVLGYLVLQFFYAVPFQRDDVDSEVGFVIAPGW